MTDITKTPDNSMVDIDALSAEITKQGSLVRQLKKDGSSSEDVALAISKLKDLKINYETEASSLSTDKNNVFNRQSFDDLIVRKMFVVPSFEIHGGTKGLFDLGPPCCAVKASMIDLWRKHFVLQESMLEMECTCLTPEAVLKTSGHVERFTDLMVKDVETGECFRADKLLEDVIDLLLDGEEGKKMSEEQQEEHRRIQRQADAFTSIELDQYLLKYDCKGPSGKPYSSSFPFNLMFKTSIGPEGTSVGYLRPETAQGLFVNFRRLLDSNTGKMPFAAAQVGLGFRNEIAPRSGLIRVREFTMAEIEHFVDPTDKSHASFTNVSALQLVLFGRDDQLTTGKTLTISVGDAVHKNKLINNETLGYFMARTQLYLQKIGIDPTKLRFRQHLTTEMAHYATDCWDLEILTSYGWIECVGIADRACYDLDVHGKATKTSMLATQKLDKPRKIYVAKLKFDRKKLGQVFKGNQRVVSGSLEKLAQNWDDFQPIATALESNGTAIVPDTEFEITSDMLSYTKTSKQIFEIKYTPSVIEPSFGIGRILYALLEHSFYIRPEDESEQRCVMRFNPRVAPFKVAVLPISSNDECNTIVERIASNLMEEDISTRVDTSSASLGRRYARCDEIGVPFCVTVDFESVKDGTVTLRERDSTSQVRMPQESLVKVIHDFIHGKLEWDSDEFQSKFTKVGEQENKSDTGTETKTIVVEDTGRGKFYRPAVSII